MNPSLSLAIAHLNTGTDNFAIWVVNAPYPSGYVLHDCVWSQNVTETWQKWQQMFAPHNNLDIPQGKKLTDPNQLEIPQMPLGKGGYAARLMQELGMRLWRWLFDDQILGSLERSQGIAMGQNTRLHLRLEIRDPNLITLPWEIMQPKPGQPAISLSHQQLLFSRTISEVEALPYLRTDRALNVLLVLGQDDRLQLDKEASLLEQTLTAGGPLASSSQGYAPCLVKTLVQPTPEQLIQELESKTYNVFFYAGHGLPAPDGGQLFLRPEMTLSGIELAQALTSTGVKLAVFNACWGAIPAAANRQAIPSSSLAEVLIRHGVPAVLGMRDEIADHESHSFIHAFAQALRSRKPIDEAVAEARQQLLTVYKFNQPAWTLPILYLHPYYNGELLKSFDEGITELPETSIPGIANRFPPAILRSMGKVWRLRPGVNRIGRTADNDIVIPEPSVSRLHAEILSRNTIIGIDSVQVYYLQEKSTYGTTWILESGSWRQVHHEEVPLVSGMQLKFGSTRSQTWEFMIENTGSSK